MKCLQAMIERPEDILQLPAPCQRENKGYGRRLRHRTSPTRLEPNSSQVAGSGTGVATKPWPLVKSLPAIWPAALIPKASVEKAPGTSIVVKLAPSLRNPWADPVGPMEVRNCPTIWPAALIPKAKVLVTNAPGTSNVVKA